MVIDAPWVEALGLTDPCPHCGHSLGEHAIECGCMAGWVYVDNVPQNRGCGCRLTLAEDYDPPAREDFAE